VANLAAFPGENQAAAGHAGEWIPDAFRRSSGVYSVHFSSNFQRLPRDPAGSLPVNSQVILSSLPVVTWKPAQHSPSASQDHSPILPDNAPKPPVTPRPAKRWDFTRGVSSRGVFAEPLPGGYLLGFLGSTWSHKSFTKHRLSYQYLRECSNRYYCSI